MKFSIILFLFIGGIVLTSQAQNEWQIHSSSSITFKIKNAGFNVNGSLKGLQAKIKFSPDQLSNSSMEASLDVATIDTGIKARDNHLKKPDYFDVEKYPRITMKSQRFAKSKSGDFIGYFSLTIKETTKDIKVPFKFIEKGELSYLEGNFSINRRDFEVGGGSLVLSNQATVQLKIAMTQK